jgi:DNA-binding HxlR family transcriptional regulator/putative sterol carrier protein
VANRAYGQYCGLARAAEIVGERWALLIVRDLLVGPRRFSDLLRGLPGIPTNVLTARLKALEEAGVVRRRLLPRPTSAIVYEMTEFGQELEDAVIAFGRWGAKTLAEPRDGEVITPDSMVMALRSTFRREAAGAVRASYELRMGDVVFHAVVDDGKVAVAEGSLPGADLVIEAGPAIKAVMAGELTPAQAVEQGQVRLSGDPALFDRFAQMFRI